MEIHPPQSCCGGWKRQEGGFGICESERGEEGGGKKEAHMVYDISISESTTYVHTRVNKALTKELLNDFLHETAETGVKYGINSFLIDLQNAPNLTSVSVHYELASDKSKHMGFRPGSKHALVVSPEERALYRFVEAGLINAGYEAKVFTDEQAAIEWLEG